MTENRKSSDARSAKSLAEHLLREKTSSSVKPKLGKPGIGTRTQAAPRPGKERA
jgi:hypothetical protein